MKPNASTSSKAQAQSSCSAGPFHDDTWALVCSEDEGSISADPPNVTRNSNGNKLYPLDSEPRMLRTKRRKWLSVFSSLLLGCSIFSLGVFATLFVTSLQTDFPGLSKWINDNCFQLSAGAEKEGTPQGVLDRNPIDFMMFAPAASPGVCTDSCLFSIVESIPQNLTYGPKQFIHTSTYVGLKTLLASAQKSVHIASFYWTLKGSDTAFHDSTASDGEDIFNTLLQLGKTNKVSVQIAQNAANNETALLAEQGHAEVRTLNFTRLVGSGVLHTKFWLVDEQHFYIGSANMDWRSLTQVKELGVLVQNCPCLGKDLQKIFDVYWYLGQANASVPTNWPDQYNTSVNVADPLTVHFNNTQASVYMSSSPPQFCPGGRTSDIDAILNVIHEAKHFVYIAVMDYSPTTEYVFPKKYWPVIDDALRRAAFERRVSVRLLVSKWAHTKKDMYHFVCSLSMMGHLHYPKTNVDVKLFEVPIYSKNQSEIPFARVNHNKYMVTDQHAYIGTSNWSGDYFVSTGGVGFIVKQPEGSMNTTKGNMRQQLHDVFVRDWYSNYTQNLNCSFNSPQAFDFEL